MLMPVGCPACTTAFLLCNKRTNLFRPYRMHHFQLFHAGLTMPHPALERCGSSIPASIGTVRGADCRLLAGETYLPLLAGVCCFAMTLSLILS